MFGLNIYRHRYFENNFGLFWPPASCCHLPGPVLISGVHRRKGIKRTEDRVSVKREAIGIDWMNVSELDQAIPPAYTEWLGQKAIKYLKEWAA
jgi:DNA (cytosine-5)-methyltransferase 1